MKRHLRERVVVESIFHAKPRLWYVCVGTCVIVCYCWPHFEFKTAMNYDPDDPWAEPTTSSGPIADFGVEKVNFKYDFTSITQFRFEGLVTVTISSSIMPRSSVTGPGTLCKERISFSRDL